MNLSLPSVVLFLTGAVLVYAAIQNDDPRDVLRRALGGQGLKYPSLDGNNEGRAIGGVIKGQNPEPVATSPFSGLGPSSGIPVVSV